MEWIGEQTRRLRWRARFVIDPAGFAGAEPAFFPRDPFPLREALLAEARAMPVRERLTFVTPLGRRRSLEDLLLLRRLRRDAEGGEYFDVDGLRIYFRPDHAVSSLSELLEGVLLILKEAYVSPTEFFSPEVRIDPGDVVLDLGGNIGTSALLFSRLVGPAGRVYSFEPVFHSVLRRNLQVNGIDNVQVVPKGVSNAPGEVEFSVTDKGIDSRMARPGGGGARVRLALTTLDAFLEEEAPERIDLVKMDIEGAEELALRGGRRLVERFRPRWSIASYHTDMQGDRQHPKLVRLLKELGYRVRELENRHIYAW